MKLSEFLAEAKSHIETAWTQHAYRAEGRVCAIGALERTAMAHLTEGGPTLLPKAKRMLEGKVIELSGDQNWGTPNDIVPWFNDQSSTTHEDILNLFHKAVCEAQEKGE